MTSLVGCYDFAIKYRGRVFTLEMLNRLHEILEELLQKWDCKLIEFNGEDDHVHLLFQYHPDIALSNLVNNLKSVTSRKLRQEFSGYLSSFYWKDVFWNGSYFVASCGGITISTLRRYIENQNQPDCSDNP
ncbi:IS200/IS605 family transposase [Planktothrix serta]